MLRLCLLRPMASAGALGQPRGGGEITMKAYDAATAIVLVMLPAIAPPAAAQTTNERPLRRIEVTVGTGMLSGAGLGSRDANLRANDPTPRPFRLFTTENEFARTQQVHVRAGFVISRRLGIEGGLTWSRPDLRTAVTADIEGAPPVTIAEQIDQYFIDAGVLFLSQSITWSRAPAPARRRRQRFGRLGASNVEPSGSLLRHEAHGARERDSNDRRVTQGMVPVRGFAPLRSPVLAAALDFSGAVQLAA
jgi:hypothetical protein